MSADAATHTAPYWRLSNFYFFYFATLGALVPYWGLYLKSLEFSALQIGQLMALIMAARIISPNIWGWIADHTGRRMAIVRLGSLCAMLVFSGALFITDYWPLAMVMLGFSLFWNAALPQLEATTFNHLGRHSHRYSSIRLWGSVGFILSVAGLGLALDAYSPALLPAVLLALIGGIWVASLLVPERVASHQTSDHQPLTAVLRRPAVLALLGACCLMQAGHGPYYTFYTIYLDAHGYSRTLAGGMWALGVVAEVGVFLVMHRLLLRLGLRRLLLISLALAALRWLIIGTLVESLAMLTLAQLLHAATFGIYHVTAIQLVHHFFTGRHQGRGQALYSSLSFGAGGALGSYYSGLTWDALGPMPTFGIAALCSAAALAIAWRYVRDPVPARSAAPA